MMMHNFFQYTRHISDQKTEAQSIVNSCIVATLLRRNQTEDLTRNRKWTSQNHLIPRIHNLRNLSGIDAVKIDARIVNCSLMGQAPRSVGISHMALVPHAENYLVPISTDCPSHLFPRRLRFHSFGFIRLLPN
jgi:hypothetical protein